MTGPRRLAQLGALAVAFGLPAQAASLQFCDRPTPLGAAQQDRLLRFGAIVKAELERAGRSAAVVSRSGLDLGRFGVRYSHAGVSLRSSANGAWSVRQLYYACNEQRPRLYDQGLAGFTLGSAQAELGYVSMILLPPPAADALAQRALDNGLALRLLGDRYSANAYPFSTGYQNCNQWVAEMLALAWADGADSREAAQRWLAGHGYEPSAIDVGAGLMLLGLFVPWVHQGDQPEAELERGVYRLSLPQTIEAFIERSVAGAERYEFCHAGSRIVIHRGWTRVADGCRPGAGDEVITLD